MIKRTSLLYALLVLAAVLGAVSCKNDSSQARIPVRPAGPSNSVRVYTHRYLFHDDQIFKAFEQRANAKVEVIQLSYGQLLEEAQSNGLANADLVILNDLAQIKQLEGMGMLQSFQAGIFEKQFPSRFLDPETYWAPLTRWTMGYVYRKDLLTAEQMSGYQDIAMPELRGRVAISHIDSSGLISLAGAIKAARSCWPCGLRRWCWAPACC
jgi:ABC-type thiamine transport system substrate-binding protein